MSGISARGLVLGRRRDSDARIVALGTAVARNSDGADDFAVDTAGRRSNLSIEADPDDRALCAGRMSGISARGLVLGRRRDSDARIVALGTAVARNSDGADDF